jgi:hypothetical protein
MLMKLTPGGQQQHDLVKNSSYSARNGVKCFIPSGILSILFESLGLLPFPFNLSRFEGYVTLPIFLLTIEKMKRQIFG